MEGAKPMKTFMHAFDPLRKMNKLNSRLGDLQRYDWIASIFDN